MLDLLDRRGRWQLFAMFLASLLAAALELGGIGSMYPFVLAATQPGGLPLGWGLALVGCLLAFHTLVTAGLWLACRFGNEQQIRISRRFCLGFLCLPHRWHVEHHSAHVQDALRRAQSLVETVYLPLLQVMVRGVTCLAVLFFLLWLDPLLSGLGGLLLALVFGGTYLRSRSAMRGLARDEMREGVELQRKLADWFGDVKHLHLSGGQAMCLQAYEQGVRRISRCQERRVLYQELPRIALHAVTHLAVFGLVIYFRGTLPMLGVYVLAGYRLIPGLQATVSNLLALEGGLVVLQKLKEDLRELPTCETPPQPVAPLPLVGEVRLEKITFRYQPHLEPVLTGVDLVLRKGERVALAGPTGSGKTTLLNVIVGLLEHQSGKLLVDGRELSGDALRAWHRNLGYVSQEVFLADDSLAANIALHLPREEEALQLAVHRAGLAEWVRGLPEGLETRVGERGVRLSGGQRQRVGLARALYRDPEVLILDEATNALDEETEAAILASIPAEKTVLLATHRASALRFCQRVVELKKWS